MSTIHTTLSFLFFFTFNFLDVFAVPNTHLCHPEQRAALLEFKKELEISGSSCRGFIVWPYPKTESWKNNTDCCYWDGITCNPRTGKVTEINLSSSCLYGRFHSNTLQNLAFLTILDLSYNELYGQIGSSVGKLSHLTSLNISNNKFSGQIPYSIGNLSRLLGLDFSDNSFVGEIPFTFGRLNQLTDLRVGSNKLSGNFPIAILNLTNLSVLSLSNNQFTGTLPPNITSLSNLEYLFAENHAFVGTLHSSLSPISSLANNHLGTLLLPSKLRELSLGSNNFTGPIPRSISKLVNLQVLDLSYWNTQGPVDFNIFSHLKSLDYLQLSYLNTTTKIDLTAISSFSKSLETLDLSGNHVFATNKSSVSDPPLHLIRLLTLQGCGITEFPEILRTQQNLEILDISNNEIKGQVPGWLWKLSNLMILDLSYNTLIGFERSTKHGVAPELQSLDISNNKIKGQVPGWLWTLPSLYYLDLSYNNFISFERPTIHGLSSALGYLIGSKNNFTGNIPSLVCELRSLIILDLSVNDFNGSIPHCLENLKSNLSDLNLRHNHLSGGLPKGAFNSLRSLDVGHNQLVGKLPRSLMNYSSLEVLNVESNRINDVFPLWLSSLQNLQILVLRSNEFHGPIHQASFRKLQIIDVSYNQFSGTLPSHYFVGWSAMSSLGTNKDQSTDKYMGGKSYYSIVLKNKGLEIEIVRILKVLTALDFSGNRLEGEIPDSIGLLKELYSLSLSNNSFTGHIPSSIGNLKSLESLDVSQNKLSGEIPQELGTLSFLSYMNFSHNQLVGLVPGGTQFRTQRCSSFANNSGLFGTALDEACSDIHTPSQEQYETRDAKENEEEEEVFSWIAAAIGFGPGIAFGLAIGYILVSHKPEWFRSPFARNKRKSRRTATR